MSFSENGLENSPNQYYEFPAESDLGIGTQYIEFDKNLWPIRQCEIYNNRWFNSNNTYHPELGSGGLCDQQLTEEGEKLGNKITTEVFEEMWELSQIS
jgi:hypothetical protein